jgi:hypothetical protein
MDEGGMYSSTGRPLVQKEKGPTSNPSTTKPNQNKINLVLEVTKSEISIGLEAIVVSIPIMLDHSLIHEHQRAARRPE